MAAQVDTHSQTWAAVDDKASSAIASARVKIEARGLDLADTEFLRGQIAALKMILVLGTR
jgi:hypothetical protein